MLKNLAKSSVRVVPVSGKVRIPLAPACLVRGFATSNSNNGGNNTSTPDHSNFGGAKNSTSTNTGDHGNFNGPKGLAALLKEDAIAKHQLASKTGNIDMELAARAEQSMADRLTNQQIGMSAAEERGFAHMLKMDAAEKQSLANSLQNEARAEQSLADSLLAGLQQPQPQPQQQQQQQQQRLQTTTRSLNEGDPDIEYHVGSQTFHTPYEIKRDASEKQSLAAKTHDETLMKEARLEQSVADALTQHQRDNDEIELVNELEQLAATTEDPYDIFEELTIELSEYPDATDAPQTRAESNNYTKQL